MTLHLIIAQSSGLGGLFTALGLNLQAFFLDLAAFLVTAYVIGRWVFPPLTRALDAKKDELEAAAKHEKDAQKALEQAEVKAVQVLNKARESADEVIALAHTEATAQLEAAREKARQQSERLVAEAREQLDRDVQAARRELKGETAKLVVEATEAVLGERLDHDRDAALIARSVSSSK